MAVIEAYRKLDEKRGSDGVDLVSLLRHSDPDDLLRDLAADPHLRDATAWAANEVLVDQAHRVVRLIRVYTDAQAPTDDEVRRLGELLLQLCAEAGS